MALLDGQVACRHAAARQEPRSRPEDPRPQPAPGPPRTRLWRPGYGHRLRRMTGTARCSTHATITAATTRRWARCGRRCRREYRPVLSRREPYYFSGGIWYAPRGPGFVVVRPPPGLVISRAAALLLDGVVRRRALLLRRQCLLHLAARSERLCRGRSAAECGCAIAAARYPRARMDLIIYPKNGQSKEQQAADQFECHNWAKGQTGFDPTQPGGGAPGAGHEPQQLQPRDVGVLAGPRLSGQLGSIKWS